jgi:hypothetical protein
MQTSRPTEVKFEFQNLVQSTTLVACCSEFNDEERDLRFISMRAPAKDRHGNDDQVKPGTQLQHPKHQRQLGTHYQTVSNL